MSAGPRAPEPSAAGTDRILVAGIGNVFLGDDGFGVEVVRRLAGTRLPPGVEVVDTGVRGVHLAYQLLDGYRAVVLVDTVPGGGPPGTLHVLEPEPAAAVPPAGTVVDGHRMTPDAVLALLGTLAAGTGGTGPDRVLVLGCVPETVAEGIGLSAPVTAAVDEAARLVHDLVRDLVPAEQHPAPLPAAPLPASP